MGVNMNDGSGFRRDSDVRERMGIGMVERRLRTSEALGRTFGM